MMERNNIFVRGLSIVLVISMICGSIPYITMASETIGQTEIEITEQELATYELGITEIAVEDAPIDEANSIPAPSPYATFENMYADSAIDQGAGAVPEATGMPDDVRFTFGGNANYVRGSGSTWGAGAGSILSVEIAAEWSSSGLTDDGAIIRYFDSGTSLIGATASPVDATNYAVDNTLYLDITGDKAGWTWTDVGNVNPEIYYFKAGGPDGGILNIDALWIRVQYEAISIDYDISVSTGWNLISVPSVQGNTDILSVLDDAGGDTTWERAYNYNPLIPEDIWQSYSILKPGSLNELNNVNNKLGIWVYITDEGSDSQLTVSGSPPSMTAINLYTGWNLVGYPCLESQMAANSLAGVPYDALECYDSGAPYLIRTMLDTEIMEPGVGYWIKVTSDCVWNVGDITPPTFAGLDSAFDAATGGSVLLNWNPATDPSYPITYNIYMATTPGGQDFGTPDYVTDQTNFQVDGLTDNQDYYFVVRAEDSAGNEDTNLVEKSAIPTTPDVTNPFIESTIPVDLETGIGISQSIIITFSESINTGTFAYSCTPNPGGWGESWGTVVETNDQVTLTHSELAFDTVYSFQVTAADDLAGNPLVAGPVPNPWTFTTEIGPTPPQVVEPTSPFDGAIDIAVTSNIQITFTEAMDEASVESWFSINPAAAGTFSWNPASTILTFTPSGDLANDQAYTITIDGLAEDQQAETLDGDYDGNSEGSPIDDYSFSFTTAAAPDLTGPVTSGVNVAPNPTDGAATVTLTATVDDSTTGGSNIAEAEYFVDSVGADGSGTAMAASDGNFNAVSEGVTATIDVSGWADGTYTLYVHGRDSAANWGATDSTTLDVTSAPDIIPPQVVSNVPADGETGVVISSNIVVQFTEEMDQANTEGAFGIVPAIAGTFSWNPAGDTLTFNPSSNMDYATSYTITITTAATDLAGNTLDGDKDGNMEANNKDKWVFDFTTENEPDLTGPIVSNVQAAPDPITAGATLTLTANVDDSTTGGSNIAEAEWSTGGSAASAGSGTNMAASDGNFNTISEDVTASIDTTGWPAGTETLWVRGRDSSGNWGDAVSTSVVVEGPDLIPPQVVSNVPADGATSVALNTNIVVTFTEEMDQANTEGAFEIVPAAAGSFSWNAGGDVLTFNPSSDLVGATSYTVTIYVAATDLAGNTLDGDKDGNMEADNKDKWVFGFTTEGGGPGAKYAVVVGINKFDYLNDLTYCVNDANDVRTELNGEGYSVDILTDGQASKVGILAAIDSMSASETAGDYTAFTFSGHGGIISGKCVICPEDGYDLSTYIQKAELETKFTAFDSTHQLIFFDSCNSGGMSTLGSSGRLCIMAAASNQYSWDGQPDIANGVWTYYFWEDGISDGGAGTLILEDVFTYAKPLAKAYVEFYYTGYTMDAQISDGYTGDFYL